MIDTNLAPTNKIGAVAFGSALGVIITIFVTMDATAAAALTGALGTIAGYMMPDTLPWKKSDVPVDPS